jgi:phage terminase large subunit
MKLNFPVPTNIYWKNFRSRADIVVNRGGTRSSKSFSLLQLLFVKAAQEHNKRFLFLRKTFPSLRLSSLADWRSMIGMMNAWPMVKEEKQEHNYIINRNLIHFDSLDDPQKKKSTNWNYIFFEEMTDFTYDDFRTMKLYLSRDPGKDKNQIFGAFNPIDENSWVKTELIDKGIYDIDEIVSTWKDNAQNLHSDVIKYIQDLELQDSNFHRIYTLGQWGRLENLIYTNWDIASIPERASIIETIYGIDFGFSNPCAIVRVDLCDGTFYATELLYKSKLTPNELLDEIDRVIGPNMKEKYIFCDNAEPAMIQSISEAGYNAWPAEKDVRDGINRVKRFHFHITPNSPNLIKEARGYSYKKNKDGRMLEEPIKFHDHLMDGLRYALHTYYVRFYQEDATICIGGSSM